MSIHTNQIICINKVVNKIEVKVNVHYLLSLQICTIRYPFALVIVLLVCARLCQIFGVAVVIEKLL